MIFRKNGSEIQESIGKRITALQSRLDKRNASLDTLINDPKRLRSYLVRSSESVRGHGMRGQYMLVSEDDISSEEKEEIDQMLRRILEIEQEIRRLKLTSHHLDPDTVFELTFDDLISYGFDTPDI